MKNAIKIPKAAEVPKRVDAPEKYEILPAKNSVKVVKDDVISIPETKKSTSLTNLAEIPEVWKGVSISGEVRQCNSLTTLDLSKWDTSNITELKSLSNLNEKQIKYCWDKDLFHNYPMVGMAAIIDAKIKPMFEKLGS